MVYEEDKPWYMKKINLGIVVMPDQPAWLTILHGIYGLALILLAIKSIYYVVSTAWNAFFGIETVTATASNSYSFYFEFCLVAVVFLTPVFHEFFVRIDARNLSNLTIILCLLGAFIVYLIVIYCYYL